MTHAPDDYALVIGISHYPNWNEGKHSLEGPVGDAEGFRDWLICEAGGGLTETNVKLVVSSQKELGPRQFLIDDALRSIRDQSSGRLRRRFYFYFAGHGHSRAGAREEHQALCLANWSPEEAGAALDLDSYVATVIGCLKFSEAVFFLDCCRRRAVVPVGHLSDLECGSPDRRGRSRAVFFPTDHNGLAYEGGVGDAVRGYFTTGLLSILKEGTIELRELLDRLRIVVPKLALPKDQTVRADPADTLIYLGPPAPPHPPTENRVREDGFIGIDPSRRLPTVSVLVSSNLTGANSPDDQDRPPRVGNISLIHDNRLVGFGVGGFTTRLVTGRYEVRIEHAEASATHVVDVADKDLNLTFQLPRRTSPALLSSTIGKQEHFTDPVIAASRWNASGSGQQAAFIALDPRTGGDVAELVKSLFLVSGWGEVQLSQNNWLQRVPAGTSELRYVDPSGATTILPVPIARGWDTHIFIPVVEGNPRLASASVSMKPAGAGFAPSDALIDSYERAIADFGIGGPGPDPALLDAVVGGKYRNPLYGLLGAYFLIRRLRHDAEVDGAAIQRLRALADSLGDLLGQSAPDIVALRLWIQLITKTLPTERLQSGLPLFNVGFQAFVEATARSDAYATRDITDAALSLDANSPWTCRRVEAKGDGAGYRMALGKPWLFVVDRTSASKINFIEQLWREAGLRVERLQEGSRQSLRAVPKEEGNMALLSEAEDILRTPNWVVPYMREAIGQSGRTGRPLDFVRLVRLTMLPLHVLRTAMRLASEELDLETVLLESSDQDSLGQTDTIWPAISSNEPGADRFGVREMFLFLTSPNYNLPRTLLAKLFNEPLLRDSYRRFKSRLSTMELPAAAAASDQPVSERRFPGGSLRITPSHTASLVYVLFRFESGQVPTGASNLILELPSDLPLKLVLGPPSESAVLIVLDTRRSEDAIALAALRNPLAKGFFHYSKP